MPARTGEETVPVTYNRPIEAPFLAKDILKEVWAVGNVRAVDAAVAIFYGKMRSLRRDRLVLKRTKS